jgi:hypothetical protein
MAAAAANDHGNRCLVASRREPHGKYQKAWNCLTPRWRATILTKACGGSGPEEAAIVFSIARNHLIGMTCGKRPAPAARLPKTNQTGLLSEAKADCLGKSTSSSASG